VFFPLTEDKLGLLVYRIGYSKVAASGSELKGRQVLARKESRDIGG
jgi:hypothetical protein